MNREWLPLCSINWLGRITHVHLAGMMPRQLASLCGLRQNIGQGLPPLPAIFWLVPRTRNFPPASMTGVILIPWMRNFPEGRNQRVVGRNNKHNNCDGVSWPATLFAIMPCFNEKNGAVASVLCNNKHWKISQQYTNILMCRRQINCDGGLKDRDRLAAALWLHSRPDSIRIKEANGVKRWQNNHWK